MAEANDGKKVPEFVFEEHEAEFLVHLAGNGEQFKQMVVLFGLAEAAKVPRTPAALVQALVNAQITAKLPDVGDTIHNLQFIVLLKTRDEVMLFRMGRHPEFRNKKPSSANYLYFKALEASLTKQMNENRNAAKSDAASVQKLPIDRTERPVNRQL